MVGPGINACAETVSNTVSYALTDPKGFGLALWHGTTDPIVDDWNSGNYGEAIGRGIFAIAELALGTKGATKLGSLPIPISVEWVIYYGVSGVRSRLGEVVERVKFLGAAPRQIRRRDQHCRETCGNSLRSSRQCPTLLLEKYLRFR